MAVIKSGTRIETDNKRGDQIETGTYNITIVGEWVHFVTKELVGTWNDGQPKYQSKYSKEPTGDEEIKISVTLDDAPEIALSVTMSAYISKNSKFGKMCESLTGQSIKELQLLKDGFDTKTLVGLKGVADIKNSGDWVNIKEIRARPKTLARPAIRPSVHPAAAQAFTPADAAKLGIAPMNEDEFDESQIPF